VQLYARAAADAVLEGKAAAKKAEGEPAEQSEGAAPAAAAEEAPAAE
jgi:hypothetical protein